jgi:hypothetical protein
MDRIINKIVKSSDGMLWLDVTDKAEKLFKADVFQLFFVWESEGKTLRIPIDDEDDLKYALNNKGIICLIIEGDVSDVTDITKDSWESADKISHNGFIYVRYSDLIFCK